MNTTTTHRMRRLVRTALFSGALAVAVSPFAGVAIANAEYKETDFSSCLDRDMPTDYCCEHAGGVMRKGACIDPEELLQPSPGTQPQPQPHVVLPNAVLQQIDSASTPTPSPLAPVRGTTAAKR